MAAPTIDCEIKRYYRQVVGDVADPIRWWVDHQDEYPRLSRLGLDILAIPTMASDCERASGLAKLSVTSQRHSMLESTLEMLQLLKNWIRHAGIFSEAYNWRE